MEAQRDHVKVRIEDKVQYDSGKYNDVQFYQTRYEVNVQLAGVNIQGDPVWSGWDEDLRRAHDEGYKQCAQIKVQGDHISILIERKEKA